MPKEPDKAAVPKSGVDHIRARPGMYIGTIGPLGIPRVLNMWLDDVFRSGAGDYRGQVELVVKEEPPRQKFFIYFGDCKASAFPPDQPDSWIGESFSPERWEIFACIAVTRRCRIESSDGRQTGTKEWVDGRPAKSQVGPTSGQPYLKFEFELEPSLFQKADVEQLYRISGMLKTASALRGGLATRIKADQLPGEIQHCYRDGLKSLVLESDHQRFPLHPGCLSFAATQSDMSVEGHLRFVHAGTAAIFNYANYNPTQGGAHVEGLGEALHQLFGKEARGCRPVVLITNPDTGQRVELPHCCIGALHVKLRDAKYYGPTKDVLLGDDVKDFVYQTAITQLPSQWEDFNR